MSKLVCGVGVNDMPNVKALLQPSEENGFRYTQKREGIPV